MRVFYQTGCSDLEILPDKIVLINELNVNMNEIDYGIILLHAISNNYLIFSLFPSSGGIHTGGDSFVADRGTTQCV